MKILEKMTKDEKSLLLYLETRAVDYSGFVDTVHMNKIDMKIAKKWNEDGFLLFKRATKRSATGEIEALTYEVMLSDEAWVLVGEERKLRAERLLEKRNN